MKHSPEQCNQNDRELIIYNDFLSRTDSFVGRRLSSYEPQHFRSGKVIHDCIWGTTKFFPWEIQLIDSPLFQRLRYINQLGLAFLTYPSAHHSRFEHTLGVVAVVTKMVDSINQEGSVEEWSGHKPKISYENIFKLRMAALLHDIGHCFFSHVSESIYSQMEELSLLKSSFEVFKRAQPHELLAYMIVNTPSFRRFLEEKSDYPFKGDMAEFTRDIGRMIVGAKLEPRFDETAGAMVCPYYMTQIINGQFDADSLDYLRRDSYATGLALTYHIDRFLYKLRFEERIEAHDDMEIVGQYMTIPVSGISSIEEMMFNKLMLSRYIYQHKKVVAVESLVRDVVHGLNANGKLLHPCDFLEFTDSDIYRLCEDGAPEELVPKIAKCHIDADSKKTISELVHEIMNRDLPKRAVIINCATIRDKHTGKVLLPDELASSIRRIPKLRRRIFEKAREILAKKGTSQEIELFDVHIAVPKPGSTKDYSGVYVVNDKSKLIPISQVVDLNNIAASFKTHSWNAYVFSKGDLIPIVEEAAKRVLFEFDLIFLDAYSEN